MSTAQTVDDGVVVLMRYTLKDDAGEILDSNEGDEPMAYLHGAGNIVTGLEKALLGKHVGDQIEVAVPPAEGYGEKIGAVSQPVERSNFPENVDLVVGMQFLTTHEGETFPVWIEQVEEDHVLLTRDHPLAGETLHFKVQIAGLRPASEEERTHQHVHGPEGHHH